MLLRLLLPASSLRMRNNIPNIGRAIYTAHLPLYLRLLELPEAFFLKIANKPATTHSKRWRLI
jgi:hypothetical protein